MNRKSSGSRDFERVWERLFEQQKALVDLRRERASEVNGGCFFSVLGRERVMGAAVSENVEVWGYVMAVQDLRKVGFHVLTQPTEITVSLFIFDK